MITQQEFFDQTVRFLHNQGGKSRVAGQGCRYTTPDGRHCAIGMWINPACYDKSIEGLTILSPYSDPETTLVWEKLVSSIGEHDWLTVGFAAELQAVHDLAASKGENWLLGEQHSIDRKFTDLALKWKLSDAVVKECWP